MTEPYSAGIGGGGFFVYYDARKHRVSAVDGRETAPVRMRANAFVENGRSIPVAYAVTSGLSVGVPGTPATWHEALKRWGTISLRQALGPAIGSAERGFVVDKVFRQQTGDNAERFRRFTSTRGLFLPGGAPPPLGSVFRNPDLAATYRLLARKGVDELYRGRLGREIAAAARRPPIAPGTRARVRPGLMAASDLARYTAPRRPPAHVRYRGLDVYGMAPPSSGGTRNTAEALAEPAYNRRPLEALGHRFATTAEIGAATGIELRRNGRLLAAAEPTRRSGGHAGVVRPGRVTRASDDL